MTQPTSQENRVERLAEKIGWAVDLELAGCGMVQIAAALIAAEEALEEARADHQLETGTQPQTCCTCRTEYRWPCSMAVILDAALALVRALPGLKVED